MPSSSTNMRRMLPILLTAIAASLLVVLARVMVTGVRLAFCLAALVLCMIVMRPSTYQFVPDGNEWFDSESMPLIDNASLIVPNIIHQTYITEDIPRNWEAAQDSCKTLHQDYQYMFWTDASGREFVETHYRWLLSTYDSYPHPIQRVDALRYMLLHHYGGVYLDLDVGCRGWRLDRLRQYPAVLPTTDPTGFSNDVMVFAPGHPLLAQMLRALPHWAYPYGTKYPTVMFSTGPMFLSVQYMMYKQGWAARPRSLPRPRTAQGDAGAPAGASGSVGVGGSAGVGGRAGSGAPGAQSGAQAQAQRQGGGQGGSGSAVEWGTVWALPQSLYGHGHKSFFVHYEGNSWHGADSAVVFWLYSHLWLVGAVVGVLLLLALVATAAVLRKRRVASGKAAAGKAAAGKARKSK